jgi:hypothetical protein
MYRNAYTYPANHKQTMYMYILVFEPIQPIRHTYVYMLSHNLFVKSEIALILYTNYTNYLANQKCIHYSQVAAFNQSEDLSYLMILPIQSEDVYMLSPNSGTLREEFHNLSPTR